MGTCNGVLSSCAWGGYAMETASVNLSLIHKHSDPWQQPGSRCHLGKSIVYDTVSNSSWSVDIRTHGIVNVIERLLAIPWPPSVEIGREVPEAVAQTDCVVSINIFEALKMSFLILLLVICKRNALIGSLVTFQRDQTADIKRSHCDFDFFAMASRIISYLFFL